MVGKKIISVSVIASAVLLFVGCGSSGDNNVVAPPPAVTNMGFYLDSAVEGIKVTCDGVETTTDATGSFAFADGATCTFNLNDILLRTEGGMADGAKIFEDNILVAQLLQSLDNDNDPTNGITITPEVLKALEQDGVVTLPATDEELASIIARLQQAGIGFGGDFVSKEDAQAHLDATKRELDGKGSNKPPVAVAGDDFTAESGTVLKLDGGRSSDPDGEIVSYRWVMLGNEGNPRDQKIGEFGGLHDGEYRFKLTVTDNEGATASDEVKVTIKNSNVEKISNAIVGKDLYKPQIPAAVVNIFKRISNNVHRPVVEKYGFSADGTNLTFDVAYTDDPDHPFVHEEYTYDVQDGYVALVVVSQNGADSFPVGTRLKLNILDITNEYVEVKEELIGGVDDIPAGAVKMYYSAEQAAQLAQGQ